MASIRTRWADREPELLLDNVSPIWTTTTAPYGPAFILVAKFVTMLVGDNVIAGTMVLRLCMLPGLAMLVWAAPRIARHIGANGAVALWICALNPLVIIHLMGGVHNEMLMVGLMMAGIALTLARHPVPGVTLVAVGVAVKATAGLALPFLVWVWMRQLRDRSGVACRHSRRSLPPARRRWRCSSPCSRCCRGWPVSAWAG